ncbi:MAG: tagaturonate reductase [Gemmatimonadota bacterium]
MTDAIPQLGLDVVQSGAADTSGALLPSAQMLALPERAIQFGTGAFLRGFVDYFLDVANAQGRFNGRVVAVGSTGSGRDRAFAEQDGLFTLVSRGLVAGKAREETRVIGSVSRALSASDDWSAVLECARNPQLSVIFSNTTEVGIALDESDAPGFHPPKSFPGKLTRFLYERARAFAFAPSKGLVVVPCELIEGNGDTLRQLVLDLAARWGYEPGFRHWIEHWVHFCNTLVDRIVPGAPGSDETALLTTRLGYTDALLTTAEQFRLFVIEGDDSLRARLDFADADTGIVITRDVGPYRERKLRLLNGAHTMAVSMALLAGCESVRDAMVHPQVGTFIRRVQLDEILPTVDAPDAEEFAHATLDRFENPHIQHLLTDITLHGTTKLRVRVVPILVRAAAQRGRVPEGLALGFAAHLAYLRGDLQARRRASGQAVPVDVAGDAVHARWVGVDVQQDASVRAFVQAVAADEALWGTDLGTLPGFVDSVTRHLAIICTAGAERALDALLTAGVA